MKHKLALLLCLSASVITSSFTAEHSKIPHSDKIITATSSSADSLDKLIFKNARELPFPLFYHACVTDNEFAYTVGGFSGTGISRQVLRYDPKVNNWSVLTNKLTPLVQATASYIQETGKIYVIGGLSSIRNYVYNETIQSVDVKTGEVKTLAVKNPLPVAYSGSAVWKNKIYIFGGSPNMTNFNTARATNAVYEFDPLTEKFTKLPDMPEMVQATGAVVDGILYVFGGYNAAQKYTSNHIYAYDINKKTWESAGKLPARIATNGISTSGHFIFITGDYSDKDFSGYFDTKKRNFTMIKSNFADRSHSGAVVLHNHLMVIGGTGNAGGVRDAQVADLKELTGKTE